MPTNDTNEQKEYLKTKTNDIKFVSDYTGLNFNECLSLDCYTFKVLLKDAYIYELRKTDEGKEYLENCYILSQTSPDRKKLRERFNK